MNILLYILCIATLFFIYGLIYHPEWKFEKAVDYIIVVVAIMAVCYIGYVNM